MSWKEAYANSLNAAGGLYAQGNLEALDRLFRVMREQIHSDEARKDLKMFEKKVENSYNEQLAEIDKSAQTASNIIQRRLEYAAIDGIVDWKLGQILKKHQVLARKYRLVE